MKTKRIKEYELMDSNYSKMVDTCLEIGAFRLLGVFWKKYVKYWRDPLTNDIVFEYE